MRRLAGISAPAAVATGALAVGVIDVLAALAPGAPWHVEPLAAVLPVGTPSVARSVTFAAGAALIWVAAGLGRRKRRAWILAMALVVLASVAHLARGLDLDQASVSAAFLVALVCLRRRFDVTGDPTSLRPVAGALLVALAAWAVVGSEASDHLNRITDLGFELILAAAGVRAFHVWLRAHREPVAQTAADAIRARRLVLAHGHDTLSFFALRRDRRYHFSAAGNAMLAYRVRMGCALVCGDPIGSPAEIPGLVHAFRRFAHGRGWRVVVLHASDRHLALYRGCGMRAVAIGDEAVLRPEAFCLDGRAIRKVRQSVSRLERAGYRVEVRGAGEVCDALRGRIREIDCEWLGGAPDRGLTMAMDDPFGHAEARFALAFAPDGGLGGYLHLVPHLHGYSLAAMRRRSDTPNGMMEWLICRTVAETGAAGAQELSLNFAVFAALLRAGPNSPHWMRAGRRAVLTLDRAFQVDRLYSFNRKFAPEWRTRYVCFERALDVPVLSLATAHAEGLLPVADRLPARA